MMHSVMHVAGWRDNIHDWSIANVCKIRLQLSGSETENLSLPATFQVELTLLAYVPRRIPWRRVQILVGGIVVASQLLFRGGQATIRFMIAWHRDTLEVALVSDPVGSPAEYGEGPDRRLLGLKLIAAKVCRSDPIPAYKLSIVDAGRRLAMARFPAAIVSEPWSNINVLTEFLQDAIRSCRPTSFIRLGDGEGRLLGYPNILSETETLRETLGYMFGPTALEELRARYGVDALSRGVNDLRAMLIEAITAADAVGVPAPVHFRTPCTPNNVDGLVGFSAVHLYGAKWTDHIPAHLLFDTFIPRPLYSKGNLKKVLSALREVTVVSHTDLSSEISQHFEVPEVYHVAIPGHYSFMKSDVTHYPAAFPNILERLQVRRKGSVFLIAAGYLGKVYAHAIKQRGGIAIDIGSVFDAWSGRGRTDAKSHQAARLVPRTNPPLVEAPGDWG